MATAATYTKTGAKASKNTSLTKEVFGLSVDNHQLLRQAYEAYAANGRINSARTKTRAEVRGGGRKPWRQKGTGNARAGSRSSPIWRSGGITFGPTGIENYTKKVNASANVKACKQALTLKAEAKAIAVVEDIPIKDGKTKELKSLLDKLKLSHSVLIVVDSKSDLLMRAASNLEGVNVALASYLNVKTILDSDHLLFTKQGLLTLEERFGEKK